LKRISQPWNLQTYLPSLSCHRLWACSSNDFLYDFPQPGTLHLWVSSICKKSSNLFILETKVFMRHTTKICFLRSLPLNYQLNFTFYFNTGDIKFVRRPSVDSIHRNNSAYIRKWCGIFLFKLTSVPSQPYRMCDKLCERH
jgi:hypothetical protein